MERALRKVKVWLDSDEKLKHRHVSLLLFLDLTGDSEQAAFFREHRSALYEYCLSCYRYICSKLAEDAQYRENTEKLLNNARTSPNSYRELLDHLRLPLALNLIVKYAATELVSGGPDERYLDDVIKIVCSLLHTQGHSVLWREGMKTVLMWLRDVRLPPGIFKSIFGEAVRMQPFYDTIEGGSLPDRIKQTPTDSVAGSSKLLPPLVPMPSSVTPLQQSVAKLKDLLYLVTFEGGDSSVSKASIAAIYQYLKEAYIGPVYDDSKHIPEIVQVIFIEYFAIWTVQYLPDGMKSATIPTTCFILSELLLKSEAELQLVLTILGHGHQLPLANASAIRTAMAVIRQWTFSSRERRPSFLSDENSEDYLGGFLAMTVAVFFTSHSFIGYQTEQVGLYRDALQFIRQLMLFASTGIRRQIIESLLQIGQRLFAGATKYSVIVTPGVAEDFSGFYGDTLFGCVIRGSIKEEEQWVDISRVCRALSHWGPFVAMYGDICIRLTAFVVDQVITRVVNLESTDTLTRTSSPRPSDFALWNADPSLLSDENRMVFIWRNLLTVFGPLDAVKSADNQFALTRTFVTISDRLMSVRQSQSYADCAPVFEVFEQLFQAACYSSDLEGRRLALMCISRLVGGRLGLAIGDSISNKAILSVIKGLQDEACSDTAIEAANNLFCGGDIKHCHVLVAHLLPHIATGSDQTTLKLLGDVAALRIAESADAWSCLKDAFYRNRNSLEFVDMAMPIICTVTISNLQWNPLIAKEGIKVFVDSLTPVDNTLSTSLVWSLECLFQAISDQGQRLEDLMDIFDRLILCTRTCFIIDTAGNPKASALDRLGGVYLGLLTKFVPVVGLEWLNMNQRQQALFDLLQEALENPHGLSPSAMADAAHRLMSLICMRLSHFPGHLGPESIDHHHVASYLETASNNSCHFVLGEDTLFSIVQQQSVFMIVVRAATGRIVWEVSIPEDLSGSHEWLPIDVKLECNLKDRMEPYCEFAGPWPADDDIIGDTGADLRDRLPRYCPDSDMLGKLIDYLRGPDLGLCRPPDDGADDSSLGSLCRARFAEELKVAEKYDMAVRGEGRERALKEHTHSVFNKQAPKADHQPSIPDYVLPRQWLSCYGLLSKDAFLKNIVEPLKISSSLSNDIRSLDSLPARLSVKAALVYVPQGSESEADKYSVQSSQNYLKFAQSLGWLVDLDKHQSIGGYSAGLDSHDTVDGLMRYYSDASLEIAWHESCRLNSSDIQRLGSDLVHVVWNEHVRDYRAENIRGHVEIAISPLSATHCSVKVTATHPDIASIGPLRGYSIQPLAILGCLIRSTVVTAHCACLARLSRQPIIPHPFTERVNAIRAIRKKHGFGTAIKYSDYLTSLCMLRGSCGKGEIGSIVAAAAPQSPSYVGVDEIASPVQASRAISSYILVLDEGDEAEESAAAEREASVAA